LSRDRQSSAVPGLYFFITPHLGPLLLFPLLREERVRVRRIKKLQCM